VKGAFKGSKDLSNDQTECQTKENQYKWSQLPKGHWLRQSVQ
jgi:hypothetical protein